MLEQGVHDPADPERGLNDAGHHLLHVHRLLVPLHRDQVWREAERAAVLRTQLVGAGGGGATDADLVIVEVMEKYEIDDIA